MIKTYFIQTIYWLVMLVAGSSCSCNDNPGSPELIVSKEKYSFGKWESTRKLAIKTNINWTVSSSENWCTLLPVSGSAGTHQIEMIVTDNPDTDPRTATVTMQAGSLTEKVEIIQSATSYLQLTKTEYEVSEEGDQIVIEYEVSADPGITIEDSWIGQLPASRVISIGNITLEIEPNESIFPRTGTVTFVVTDLTETVTIVQSGIDLSAPADESDMQSNAPTLAARMGIGWNLGNSLEACSDENNASETAWGNPAVTKGIIDAVKAAGFHTVRIPCAWSGYIEDQSTHQIRESWLERVKEVVDYCVDNDMYTILNIHWDGGWLEEHPFYNKQVEVNAKQKALWEQIAICFRDYDEHLLFAGTNEVRADYNAPTDEHIDVQLSYNQTFVDAVRSTGGRNAYRNLIVQAYNTHISYAVEYMKMPADPGPLNDRLMVEVHYYDPYEFCLDTKSNKYLWGYQRFSGPDLASWGNEDWADKAFGIMKTNFVDKGIPVIVGEYGVILRTGLSGEAYQQHVEARNYYLNYVTRAMLQNGCVPVYWDNGNTGKYGFGLFDRSTCESVHEDAMQAILEAKI